MSQFAATGSQKFAVISAAGSGNNTIVAAVTGKKLVHVTPADVEIGDIFTLTVGVNSVSFVAAAATVANVTAGLASAWNNAATPEFTGVTAADATTHITLTGDVVNVDFGPVVPTTTEGGGTDDQTLVVATQANATFAKKIRVLSLYMMINGTVTARFESDADGSALTGQMVFDKAGALGPRDYNLAFSEAGHFETVAGELLNLELSGAVACLGSIVYQEIN